MGVPAMGAPISRRWPWMNRSEAGLVLRVGTTCAGHTIAPMPTLNVRLSLDELIALKGRAYEAHTTMSELVRRLVLAGPAPDRRRRAQAAPTGTDPGLPDLPPLERTRRYRRRRVASRGAPD
jgi:hypothetical protein